MKRIYYLTMILLGLTASACASAVHSDYPQYLTNNEASVTYPNVADSVEYYLDPRTEKSQHDNSLLYGWGR